MALKLVMLLLCGYSVYVVSTQLVHIQSCRQASLDTQCLLTYIRDVKSQLVTQNEQLLVNTTRHLAKKSKLNRLEALMELMGKTITSQSELLSNVMSILVVTKTELLDVIEELNGHVHVLTLKNEIIETKIELISQKLTNQNQNLSSAMAQLATETELEIAIEKLIILNQTVTKQSENIANKIDLFSENQLHSSKISLLAIKTEFDNVIENLAGHIQALTLKSQCIESKNELISQNLTDTIELLSSEINNFVTKTELDNVFKELTEHIQSLTIKSESIATQMEEFSRKVTNHEGLFSNEKTNLATKTKLDNSIEELTRHIQALNLNSRSINTQIEDFSQKVTDENELLSNGIENLSTKHDLDNVIEEITEQIRALTKTVTCPSDQMQSLVTKTEHDNVIKELMQQIPKLTLKTEVIETQMEVMLQKVTDQNDLFYGMGRLATKLELDGVIEELTIQIQTLTGIVTTQSNQMHSLATKTGIDDVIEEMTEKNQMLSNKSEPIEMRIEVISQAVNSQNEEIESMTIKLSHLTEELIKSNQEITGQTERIASQNELFARKILEKVDRVFTLTELLVSHTTTPGPNITEIITDTDPSLEHGFPSLNQVKSLTQSGGPVPSINDRLPLPEDCEDIYALGETNSGVYTIYAPLAAFRGSRNVFHVYCDHDNDNGGPGWLVIQRREDDSVSFNRTWSEYREGFGNLKGNFWLGNQNLAIITGGDTSYELRIDLQDWNNEKRHALYSTFRVLDESQSFRLLLGEYSGNAGGDSMRRARNSKFSTRDMDNDAWFAGNCAWVHKSGFWHNRCGFAFLNDRFSNIANVSYNEGIVWYDWHGYKYSLKAVQMKIRPFK